MENSEHVEKYYDVLYVLDSEIEHKICRFSFRYLKRMIQKKKKKKLKRMEFRYILIFNT